jgi:ZIP family zinc transporter
MARLVALVTLAAVAVLVAGFLWLRPFTELTRDVPPVEDLAFERVWLDAGGIHAVLRAGGSEPVVLAQVQVDGGYRAFTQDPDGPIPRLRTARVDIPYPWVAGEPVAIVAVTSTGITFAHVIDVAVGTQALEGPGLVALVGIGLFVGFVPILVGYGFLPFLRAQGARGRDFSLGLTIGLLVFLLVDTTGEGLDFAAEASGGLHAGMAFWSVALLTAAALVMAARLGGGRPEGARLAVFVALGIGFHNLGEGIAIGASVTLGEVALASFLIVGFFLHNLSEAIAIAAPYRGAAIGAIRLLLLALLAGGPAALGTVTGAFAFTPFRATLAFAIGAGAILQVLFELVGLMLRGDPGRGLSAPVATGFGGGLALMYLTTLLIAG